MNDKTMQARADLWRSFLAAAAAMMMLAAPLAARVSIGTASSLEDDRVLYRERRVESWRDGALVSARVEYSTPEGEIFATKTIRFDSGATTPEFTFVDYREEFREGAVTGAGTVELFSGAVDELERRRAELPEAPVIDAGFDNLIRREFDRLVSGERLTFDFAVPAEQRFFRFQVEKTGETAFDGRLAVELRMRPANPLLRLLVDPIRLVYDNRRRLREFAGISDIRDDEGNRYLARIVFEYPSDGGAGEALGAG